MLHLVIALAICSLGSSCDKKCPSAVHPWEHTFRLIDSSTNQNLLNNGTFTSRDIRVESLNGIDWGYDVWDNSSDTRLALYDMVESGEIHCRISYADSIEFVFYVRGEVVRYDRCFSRVEDMELRIENISYTHGETERDFIIYAE